ncbi:MAG TPA: nicotinate phosphoribosyltransferase [Spirochaetota bacterium]|nr:nicotinate phosphoribosyltransferase [Spirochaetota bacterium]
MNKFASLSLLTDFYELTMMQGYFFMSRHEEAVFEMFFRRQPFSGGYTVYAGLDPLLDEIEKLRFSPDDIEFLDSQNIFHRDFLDYLAGFRFTGDIHSVPEGSVVFPNEPLLRVTGTIIEAQLMESLVLNFLNFQSLIATKTARIVDAAEGDTVMEFGLRRAQGVDGALSATRASFIGGATSTSNTLAAKLFNIPPRGTMAHSWVSSFESELRSFEKYAELYPDSSVLLVDTYDTLKSGVPNAIRVFTALKETNPSLMAIRIDSGDLEYLSRESRKMLDLGGLDSVGIIASNEIDEWIIEQLKNKKAPINAWGVGTRLVTGGSDPALTGVYKIAAKKSGNIFEPCIKISNQAEKISNPGTKNIFRFFSDQGQMVADLLCLEDEEELLLAETAAGKPIRFNHPLTEYSGFTLRDYGRVVKLLEPVMIQGKRCVPGMNLEKLSERRRIEIDSLDRTYRRFLNPHTYRVSLSNRLKELKTKLINDIQHSYTNH